MEVKIIGFDYYEYKKDGIKKEGGNVYAILPIKEKGYGSKYFPVYIPVRAGSENYRKLLNLDFKGPFDAEIETEIMNNGKTIVTGIIF